MKTLAFAFAAVAVTGMFAHAGLVINGDFESGSLSSWTGLNAGVTSDPADVHGGQFAAELDPVASYLSQTVPISGGQSYELDFFAKASGAGTLTVGLDGLPSISLAFPGSITGTYQEYSYLLTPSAAGDLWFSWTDESTHAAYIDDVSLVAVSKVDPPAIPEASTALAGAALLLPLALVAFQARRRNLGPGIA